MGHGAKNLKNRRHKVVRRAKSNRTKYKNLVFTDDNVRKHWNLTMTKAANYERLGLVGDPNKASISALNPRAERKVDPAEAAAKNAKSLKEVSACVRCVSERRCLLEPACRVLCALAEHRLEGTLAHAHDVKEAHGDY
jgi:hypothetical protein